jgi:hypothetical protein
MSGKYEKPSPTFNDWVRALNSLQIVGAFAVVPLLCDWLATTTFDPNGIVRGVAWAVWWVGFAVLARLVYDAISPPPSPPIA